MKCIVLCVCLLVVGPLLVAHGDVVTLPGLGVIEGSTTLSYCRKRTIYQFRGIPYAKPPLGELRFKRPVKWDSPWEGVINSSSFGPICPQDLSTQDQKKGWKESENCLHLNVYTNQIEGGGIGTGRAVMVFIHGGSFVAGNAQEYEPNYLLDEDVVLVVPQYRLGPLGFLSLKTEEIPGNMGMLDMILALEWVRDNIHVFGGDASRVTLFGNSAGAAAVTLLLFSPLVSDGLIQRVIAQSGSAVATWAVDPDPVPPTRHIAALVNCTYTNNDLLAKCLRSKPFKSIIDEHIKKMNEADGMLFGGNHVVWNEAGNKSFLLDDPSILLRDGNFRHLPMMSGITKHEGGHLLAVELYNLQITKNNTDTTEFRKYDLLRELLKSIGIKDRTGLLESVLQEKYFSNGEMGNLEAMIPGLADILGVADMKAPVFTMAKAMSRHDSSYLYSFNFFGRHYKITEEELSSIPFGIGVQHESELYYLFPREKVLNAPEKVMSRRMVQLWTSFAKTGVPVATGCPTWPPICTTQGPYLRIDKVPTVLKSFVDGEFMIAVKEGLTDPSSSNTNHTRLPILLIALLIVFQFIFNK